MKLGIITLYTGSEKLSKMTSEMLFDLEAAIRYAEDLLSETLVVVVNNGSDSPLSYSKGEIPYKFSQLMLPKNGGCSVGYNRGFDMIALGDVMPDYVMVINNDVRMPHKDWLHKLLSVASEEFVCAPGTSRTATAEAVAQGPIEKRSTPIYSVSAYCWLIPIAWIHENQKQRGWPIFDPEFRAYGEDNWTALVWQSRYGPHPFRIVHRSWIDHLKAQTANEITTVQDRLDSSRLLRSKVSSMLEVPGIRTDVKDRCKWYLKVLQK